MQLVNTGAKDIVTQQMQIAGSRRRTGVRIRMISEILFGFLMHLRCEFKGQVYLEYTGKSAK